MVSAYILIDTDPGKNREVANAISQIPGVLSAYPVTGPYDVIVAVDIKHVGNVTRVVLPSIQMVPHVKKTITCVREED